MKLKISWNYYRLHLIFFTIHPIIWSAVFYAANGQFRVPYIDAFFLCFSAQTVTGLSPLNLSTLTGFQQAILFWLMVTGDYTVTSWIMVMVRKRYFAQECAHVIHAQGPGMLGRTVQRFRSKTVDALSSAYLWASNTNIRNAEPENLARDVPEAPEKSSDPSQGNAKDQNLHNEVVQSPASVTEGFGNGNAQKGVTPAEESAHEAEPSNTDTLVWPDLAELQRTYSPSSMGSLRPAANATSLDFAEPERQTRYRSSMRGTGFPRTLTNRSARTNRTRNSTILAPVSPTASAHEQGFGGFSGPMTVASRFLRDMAPETYRNIERKFTLPSSGALRPIQESSRLSSEKTERKWWRKSTKEGSDRDWTDDLEALNSKFVSYIKTKTLWVGRNSLFDTENLSDEQLEEIGGVEYRALDVLSWLVPAYFIGTQLCTFIIYTAYLSSVHTYDTIFSSQYRVVPVAWFSAFQTVSAYTGGGLSLADEGMVPFIGAFTLVISLGALIIAGNMLMPVLLRLTVWLIFHMLPNKSSYREPFQFLLDHPRRCYIYLFPSHQTWFLVAVFFFLTAVEWVGFIVLDIGLPVVDSIPTGQRVLSGLFQSLGVRASGFAIVALGSLAPAVKLLYIVMMYISAYPVAMSVRSTNVYEERSLGVFEVPADESEPPKAEVFSKYLGWHIRKQLAFDLWWLAAGVLIICIIERDNLMNPDNATWFNQFQILFEIVSAYATIGLSLGIPTENYSFSGALKTGSKLILVAVMLRGRHRDLPVAVDRAILLPREFSNYKTAGPEHIIPDTENTTASPTNYNSNPMS